MRVFHLYTLIGAALFGAGGTAVAQNISAIGQDAPQAAPARAATPCAKPAWPQQSLKLGESGTVVVAMLIDDDGAVADVVVRKSSGSAALDAATVEGVRRCHFGPQGQRGLLPSHWFPVQYVWEDTPTAARLQELAAQAEPFRAGALAGDPEAIYQFAMLSRRAGGDRSAIEITARMIRVAAEDGHAKAQYEVANTLAIGGDGAVKDAEAAALWYQKAADGGEDRAQFWLASALESGKVLPRDMTRAVELYKKAALQGNSRAQERLGRWFRYGRGDQRNDALAGAYFRQAMEGNNANARVELAEMVVLGQTTELSKPVAIAMLRDAAQQREPIAEYMLASLHFSGKQVEQNDALAWSYLRRAAVGGNARSMAVLGHMLYNGIRAPVDVREGVFWLNKVASGGNAAAQLTMAQAFEHGKGVSQDNATALAWLTKAAARSAAAANYLGDAYQTGKLGLAVDLPLAEEWHARATKMDTSRVPDEWYMQVFFSR